MSESKALARLLEARAKAESEARGHFVGALALLAEQVEGAAKAGTGGKLVNVAAENQDAVTHLFGKGAAQIGDVLIEFAARLHDKLSGGGRRGGAHVSGEISDSEIRFVADAGNDGNL